MAARLGLEPRQNESESFVLPLHHRAGNLLGSFSKKICGLRNRRAIHWPKYDEWSRRWDSNPQPPVYKTGALPLSYTGVCAGHDKSGDDWQTTRNLVAPRGLEPRTN